MAINLNEVVNGVELVKACSIKPDKDSTESKTINLKIRFNNVTLKDVFDKAVSQTVIVWQNGTGRKKFDKFENHQTVTVDFASPAKTTIDPLTAIISAAKAEDISVEEYIKREIEKRGV